MKEFLKQYGKAIIMSVAVLAILTLANTITIDGKTGVLNIIYSGAADNITKTGADMHSDKAVVQAINQRSVPTIECINSFLKVGITLDLSTIFSVIDADGKNQIDAGGPTIEITDVIRYTDKKSVIYLSEDDKRNNVKAKEPTAFTFAESGIYQIYVKAKDSYNKESRMCFKVSAKP